MRDNLNGKSDQPCGTKCRLVGPFHPELVGVGDPTKHRVLWINVVQEQVGMPKNLP